MSYIYYRERGDLMEEIKFWTEEEVEEIEEKDDKRDKKEKEDKRDKKEKEDKRDKKEKEDKKDKKKKKHCKHMYCVPICHIKRPDKKCCKKHCCKKKHYNNGIQTFLRTINNGL